MKKIIILVLLLMIPTLVNAETKYLYDVLKNEAESNGLAREYTGEHHDSFDKEPTKKIYHWYTTNEEQTNQIYEKNNVIFGNFCWQMIRTTDTGGIKLVYNGIPNEGKCNNSGNDTSIGLSAFNTKDNSLAYVGYMYNPDTLIEFENERPNNQSVYGTGIVYSNGVYTLINPTTMRDENHHYTCNSTNETCSIVRYYFSHYPSYDNYLNLMDGKTIESVTSDMINSNNVNKVNSTIKELVDTWYENNLTSYTFMLEDTIFCNDRSVIRYGGFDPNGGSGTIYFMNNHSISDIYRNLYCNNITDRFSVSNEKAKLTYPVGLMSAPEYAIMNSFYRNDYLPIEWLISPDMIMLMFNKKANIYFNSLYYSHMNNDEINLEKNIRPAIALKQESRYLYGDGSKDNPYIIETPNHYKIIVEDPVKKGDIEFEIGDISNLQEGEEVKFKIVPVKGYVLKDLKIIDEENNNVDYTTTDNINFRFTMPATDVTIKPQYKEINIINPNTKRQITFLIISILILSITTVLFIKKKKYKN